MPHHLTFNDRCLSVASGLRSQHPITPLAGKSIQSSKQLQLLAASKADTNIMLARARPSAPGGREREPQSTAGEVGREGEAVILRS